MTVLFYPGICGFYWLAAFLLGVTTLSVSFVLVVSALALGRYFLTSQSVAGQ